MNVVNHFKLENTSYLVYRFLVRDMVSIFGSGIF